VAIDQERRPLIAQAGAARRADRHQAVAADLAEPHLEGVEQALAQRVAAGQLVGDVVAEQNAIAAARRLTEEAVEPDDALDLTARHAQRRRDRGDHRRRDVALGRHHVVQDRQELDRVAAVAGDDRVEVERHADNVAAMAPRRNRPRRLTAAGRRATR
jgi:hypothetical protein